jgi:hypothetical protein
MFSKSHGEPPRMSVMCPAELAGNSVCAKHYPELL